MSSQTHRGRPESRNEADNRKSTETYTLANSRVILERGSAGTVARIEKPDGSVDYAGPIDAKTRDAIRRVAIDG